MIGDVVQRFTATDDDLGINAALEYSLEQTQPNENTDVSEKDRATGAKLMCVLTDCVSL